jgi:hypothetical protein
VRAQDATTVRGTVTDAATARPVVGAIVRVGPAGAQRITRTDETGGWLFTRVPLLTLALDVRALGYEQVRRTIDVTMDLAPIAIALSRLTMLDTIRVRAAKQGLYGVVGTAKDLRPLPNATLQIVGIGGGRVTLDSTAHFFVPVTIIGTYVLRAKAPGYEPQTLSVIVSPNEGVEVALLLDSAMNGTSHKLEIAFSDFDRRVTVRGLASALVPRSELMRDAKGDLVQAIRYSPAFVNKNLRFGSGVCVFVDGIPQATLSINGIAPDEVEAVEAYGPNPRHSDRSRTLEARWPKGFPCPPTGLPYVHPGDDVVQWVAVWLKH